MSWKRLLALSVALSALLLGCAQLSASALAEPLEDDGFAEWRLDPILPPALPTGQKSNIPIGLGKVGDIEFWEPNRGLLTTAGNGSTIPPGIWAYSVDPSQGSGNRWHELSPECGATDGRIAWAGPEDFWTVSNGRPGQAANPKTNAPAPLEDNTLCHFSGGAIIGSYGKPAFEADSYLPMHAAGCISAEDCWFGGDALEEPQLGAFHLHWNGSTVEPERNPQGHAVEDMRLFEGHLYESVLLSEGDRVEEEESPLHPSILHEIYPKDVQPTFESLLPESALGTVLPTYASGSFPEALNFLHLSADEAGLWAAAGPVSRSRRPEDSEPAELTVLRFAEGEWHELLGPGSQPPGGNTDPFSGDVVNSVAAEPGTDHAWVALDSQADAEAPSPIATARIARVSANGEVSDQETLPSSQETAEGVGPKGAAAKVACPAAHDCWLVTTQGWVFHLSEGATEAEDNDPAFSSLITERPLDESLPQVQPDAPPEDDSGLPGTQSAAANQKLVESLVVPPIETRVSVPLLTNLHSKLLHRTTLQLSFHLAVKARIRLLAKRGGKVVASTPTRTFAAGNRKLLLALNLRRWPTKLALQTHALAPLPTTSTRSPGTNAVSTGALFLKTIPSLSGPFG
jgi:hypothetical protein